MPISCLLYIVNYYSCGSLSQVNFLKGSFNIPVKSIIFFYIYLFTIQYYLNGDSVNCGNGADRSSEAVWYCYYDAFGNDPTVELTKL